jgi:tyrosyl-tRNA synthetase
MTKMTLSEELVWRGFVNQTTFKEIKELDKEKRTFYHGFDASADSQTIGNLAAMMFDKVFIRHGYKAILLAGGATSLIGDPGGKDIERPMQSEDTILHNVAMAEKQLKQIFREDTFTLVNNLDWIKSMSTIEFLRDVGKYFGMSTLVQRDYIQKRIGEGGSGMSYTEFSYTLLQGYDFLHLYRKYDCTLQLAGSDQWGNSLSGVDLIRKAEGKETHVITLPLIINKSTGKKFGKSEDGAVWLDSEKTSSYKFYQFWLNVDDEGVGDYIKIYTLIAPEEFDTLMQGFQANPSDRSAQKYLAYEVTKLVHGEESAQSAKNVTATLFGDISVSELSKEDLDVLAQEIPTTTSNDLLGCLVATEVASSNGEARRLIEQGAISINGQKITANQEVNKPSLIKKGKNTFILVV